MGDSRKHERVGSKRTDRRGEGRVSKTRSGARRQAEPIDIGALDAMRAAWERVAAAPSARRDAVGIDEWPGAIAGMVTSRTRIVATGGWTAGPSTLMAVLDRDRNEVDNCRVARWLLDPLARHGIGSAMVAALARQVDVDIDEPALARAEVEVAHDRSRADVVLTGIKNDQVVVIEAKIDAPEGDAQAVRLEQDWPEAQRLVFLTVPGARLPSTATEPDRWRPLSWRWLADAAIAALENATVPLDERARESREAVADWAAGARRYLL